MRSIVCTVFLLSAVACSSVEQTSLSIDGVHRVRADEVVATRGVSSVTPVSAAAATSSAPTTVEAAAFAAPKRAGDDGVGRPYTMLRLGGFDPMGDISSLDTGFSGDLIFGNKFLPFLGIEGSLGYFEAGVPGGDKLWGIPIFANARGSLPILILEPYLGAGIGGIYTEYPGDTDWVGAWQAFGGIGVGLGQFALGLDYRYLKSGDTNDFSIEGQSLSLFASLPF